MDRGFAARRHAFGRRAALGAALCLGCAWSPLVEPLEPDPIPSPLSAAETRAAILRGMATHGWALDHEAGPNVFARVDVRRHTAVVRIEYGEDVRIHYFRSVGLECEREWTPCDRIHWSYNRWVQNLADDIEAELPAPAAGAGVRP